MNKRAILETAQVHNSDDTAAYSLNHEVSQELAATLPPSPEISDDISSSPGSVEPIPKEWLAFSAIKDRPVAWDDPRHDPRIVRYADPVKGLEQVSIPLDSDIDFAKSSLGEATNIDEAFRIFHETHDTDPLRSIKLLDLIAQRFGSGPKIDELAITSAQEAEKAVLGQDELHRPEEGIESFIIAIDVIQDPAKHNELLHGLERSATTALDKNQTTDSSLIKAVVEAIHDMETLPADTPVRLQTLVERHLQHIDLDQQITDAANAVALAQESLKNLQEQRAALENQQGKLLRRRRGDKVLKWLTNRP